MFDTKKAEYKNINDGFFELNFFTNGVLLTVYPPIENGKKVEASDVINKLLKKNVKVFNIDLINLAVARQDKTPVKIADAQTEEITKAKAIVNFSADNLKAFINVSAPDGGKDLTFDDYINILSVNGVCYGIKKELIESLSKYPIYNESICVAEGKPPVNGENGKVEYHFDTNKKHTPKINEDGTVDFRRLDLIETVSKGQILCTLVPPLPGIPGTTVTGSIIPAVSGKPASLPRGKNIELTENGHSIVSSIDGQVSYVDGKINVFNTYQVLGDVDNSTGNITFVGNVFVNGNVLSGFVIDAGGDVEIGGVVEGAFIKAGGDIILRRGMQGLGKGTLSSGGDIFARYIENGNIEAKNNIKAEAIMHTNIKCGNTLELTGRKGLLVGGTCKVGKEITARIIGSPLATVTDIEVGIEPELKERHIQLKTELSSIEIDLKKADQVINLLSKLAAANVISHDKAEMLERATRTKAYYNIRIEDIKEELIQIEAESKQESSGKVRASNFIYAGTKIVIGSSILHVKENLQYCTVYRDGADLKIGPINL